MKTLEKITLGDFESMKRTENTAVVTVDSGSEQVQFNVKHTLSLDESIMFVHKVISTVVDELSGTYYPEALDFMFKACVMEYYGQFEMPDEDDDDYLDRIYDMVYQSNAAECIMGAVNAEQLDALFDSCLDAIEHSKNLSVQTAGTDFRRMMAQMDALVATGESVFDKLDDNQLGSLAHHLADLTQNMDEKKVVGAVLKQVETDAKGAKRAPAKRGKGTKKAAPENVVFMPKPETK